MADFDGPLSFALAVWGSSPTWLMWGGWARGVRPTASCTVSADLGRLHEFWEAIA